jgi:hypothetical protein
VPKYKIRSGELDVTIEGGETATAKALAIMAVAKSEPKVMGEILGVSGGKFTGDEEVYFSTERLLEEMGISHGPVS